MMRPSKPAPVVAVVVGVWLGACAYQGEGALLVLEGDEERSCSGLHAEYEGADQLSGENMDARRRWLLQLMRQKDCRLPRQPDPKFKFNLFITG
ncbi:MAG: hypothetical protein EBT94_01535 [Alphaproteobacteria bacterium]|jgi:hypothetical protein|nr:hypothetical protein [Alphaproteobacteria bacterium]